MNKFTRRLATLVVAMGLGAGVMAAPAQAAIDTSWGRGAIVAGTDQSDSTATDSTEQLDTSWGRGAAKGKTVTAQRIDTSWGR